MIQLFQNFAKIFPLWQAFRQKHRLKIALQVSKLAFSSVVMPIARNKRLNPLHFDLTRARPANRTSLGFSYFAQTPLPHKVNGVFKVAGLEKSVLLDVDVFCIRRLSFCLVSIFREKKERKRCKYRSLRQLTFYPGHHEPADRHGPPVKSSSFTKTTLQKDPFSCQRWGGIQFQSIGFAERHD